MAIGPDIEVYPQNVESLLRERMTRQLGAEAAERFFNQLPPIEKLAKRAKLIAKQAKILDMLENVAAELPSIENRTDTAEVFDLALHKHPETNEAVGTEFNQVNSSDLIVYSLPMNVEQCEKQGTTLNGIMTGYLDKLTGQSGIAEELALSESDRDAVIEAILAANHPLDARMDVPTLRDMLQRRYDGKNNVQIAEELGNTPDALGQKFGVLVRRTRNKRVEVARIVREYVANARQGMPLSAVDAVIEKITEHLAQTPEAEEIVEQIVDQEWALSGRFNSFFDGIVRRHGASGELDITYDDKEAFINAIADLGGAKRKGTKPPQGVAVLGAMFDGLSRSQTADLFNVDSQTIGNRVYTLQVRALKYIDENGIDPLKFIMDRVRTARGDELIQSDQDSVNDEIVDEKPTVSMEDLEQAALVVNSYLTADISTSKERQLPTVDETRSLELSHLTSELLRDQLFAYMNAEGQQSSIRSTYKLLDPKDVLSEEVDYAYGRSALRRLIESDLGQAVYLSSSDLLQAQLRALADYELTPEEVKLNMFKVVSQQPGWRRKEVEHQLLIAINKMIPVENHIESESSEQSKDDENTSVEAFHENTQISEDIDLLEAAYHGHQISAEELEAGINHVFERAVSSGILTQAQADWTRRRVKGADEFEEREQGQKSATFIIQNLTDRYSKLFLMNGPAGDEKSVRVVNGLLSQFRSGKTLGEMKKIVEEAQTSYRPNAYKAIKPEETSLFLAASVYNLLEYAIERMAN